MSRIGASISQWLSSPTVPFLKWFISSTEPKIYREPFVMYEEHAVWAKMAPFVELRDAMPLDARWLPDLPKIRLTGLIIGGGLGVLIFGFAAVPTMGPLGGVLAVFFGGIPGSVAGWLFGPATLLRLKGPIFTTLPTWTFRRDPNPAYHDAINEDGEAPTDINPWLVTPITHSYLLGNADDNLSEDNPEPGVFLASAVYRRSEAPAVKREFTAPKTMWQKVTTASLAVMALCMAGVVFFTAIVFLGE